MRNFVFVIFVIFGTCLADDANKYFNIGRRLKLARDILMQSNGTNFVDVMQKGSALSNAATMMNFINEVSQIFDSSNAELDFYDVMRRIIKETEDDSSDFANITSSTESPLPEISDQCWNHTAKIVNGVLATKLWALRMIDALFKIPAGLMTGQTMFLGDYDECIGVESGDFNGQYCLTQIWITNSPNPITMTISGNMNDQPLLEMLTQGKGYLLSAGLCIPSSCTMTDVKNLLNPVLLRLSNNTVSVSSGTCQDPDKPYDERARIVLCVIFVFIGVISIATVYDIIIRKMSKSKRGRFDEKKNDGSLHFISDGQIKSGYEYANGNTTQEEKYKVSQKEQPFPEKRIEPGTLGKLLLSFSVYTNGEKLLSTKQGAGTLTAVNGIRFISMTWVILGHTLGFGITYLDNGADVYKIYIKRISFMAIMNALVSVDTFFALSGTLLTYLVLKQLQKQDGTLNWGMFYFHRFWRLTPPYMLVLMVHLGLTHYLGSGPQWGVLEKNFCKDSWWYNLLYINNFRNGNDECFGWAWYLANDMQFFVVSPVLIIALYKSKIAGAIVTGCFLIGTTITAGIVSKHFELGVSSLGPNSEDYFNLYYQRPYCRMGPYLVGMYTGYLLFKTNCKCKINMLVNLLLWIVFATCASAVLYGVYNDFNGHLMSVDAAAAYNALHRTIWGAAVCWVIFACATGNGGFINTILSWKAFIPLSRLTYCAYLVHPIVIMYYYKSRKRPLHWDDHEIIYEFLGHLGVSYAVAFIASLAFESPMMGLEKVVLKKKESK